MGVSGSGKSTLGRALADSLSWTFIEGDDFHPPANVEKMRRGEPLNDVDRQPWLQALNARLREHATDSTGAILACSALKKTYREVLSAGVADLQYVFLCGDPAVIRQRLANRAGHFMPASLLDSQIETLEPPKDAVFVRIDLPTADQVNIVTYALGLIDQTRYATTVIANGLAFPEGPRWHDQCLWFTDQHAQAIYQLTPAGQLTRVIATTDRPGGLGWLPDGRLLVVYMRERRVMQLTNGSLQEYADLSDYASFDCNDMLVDPRGRVYVGNFGYDLHGGAPLKNAEIILVDTDGHIEVLTDSVIFPNGCVLTPDGNELIVAETFAHRLTRLRLDGRGRCIGQSLWADLGEATPDGICLDADGAIWVASPGTREVMRVQHGGSILARCQTRGTPYACMLGGHARRTLYVCSAETDDPETAAEQKSGRIEQVEVEVPGTGVP
jgi:carbohydrate kinase (thermoresistant glucokinase family)